MNLTSDFQNSKWRTQYGGQNILETQRFSWNFVLRGFWGFLMKLDRFRNFISAIFDPLYWMLNIQFEIRNQRPLKPPSIELCKNRRVSKIPYWMDPPFRKMEIRGQIRNQRSQKPWSTKFHENRWVSKILCPSYCARHFEFRKSDFKFIISNPESFWVQSFAEIVWFPKLHVRHIGYLLFCEGYGYLRSVRQFFPCSSTVLIIVDLS